MERLRSEEKEATAAVRLRRDEHTQAEAELSQLRPAGRAAEARDEVDDDEDPQARRIRDLQGELSTDQDKLRRLRDVLGVQRSTADQCRAECERLRSTMDETAASVTGLEERESEALKALAVCHAVRACRRCDALCHLGHRHDARFCRQRKRRYTRCAERCRRSSNGCRSMQGSDPMH